MTDYRQAATRHFEDAEHLQREGRLANAGQLFGFSAECGLKALLVGLGQSVDGDGTVTGSARKHIDSLVTVINTLAVVASGRTAARYMLMMPSLSSFQDWKIDHRYFSVQNIPLTSLPDWHDASIEVLLTLIEAQADGVVL